MAQSISEAREALASMAPNTAAAMTWMVPAMEAAERNAGKRSVFGKDKGAEALGKFLGTLRTTVSALYRDGLISATMDAAEVHQAIVGSINMFAAIYPNWPDAYRFAAGFFGSGVNPYEAAVIDDVKQAIAYLDTPAITRSRI